MRIFCQRNGMKNKNLSIAIPTFNRPEILKDNILLMLPEIKEFSIPIYVADDSSDNDTEIMISELEKHYEYLFYSRNIPGLGHDRNFFYTLKIPKSEYIWLLGDSLALEKGAIENTLKIIDRIQPDIIGVNARNRDLDINSAYYNDHNRVLNELGWHLTLTGATVYSRRAVSTVDKINLGECRNFPHIGLILNHLSVACSFYWINDKWVYVVRERTSYWISNMFEIFIDDWSNVIRNLPACYEGAIKEKVIVEHSRKAKIFGSKSLLKARSLNVYNVHLFRKYQAVLAAHSELRSFTLLIIAFIPRILLRILQTIKNI